MYKERLFMWRKATKENITFDEVMAFLKEASRHEHEIILGTDSQPFNTGTFLVTAIVVICKDQQYHCRYFYKEHSKRPIHHNLYERMYSEVQHTLDVASELKENITDVNMSIHLDVSSEITNHKTARFSRSLVAMVKGYGYERVEIKPNAWCASKLADRYTKRIPLWLK